MEIRIDFESVDPPQGRLAVGDQGSPFRGWLDLIALLERVLAVEPADAVSGEHVHKV